MNMDTVTPSQQTTLHAEIGNGVGMDLPLLFFWRQPLPVRSSGIRLGRAES